MGPNPLHQFAFNSFFNFDESRFGPFNGLGHLGLPRPAMRDCHPSHDFQTRAFCAFDDFVRNTEKRAAHLAAFNNDSSDSGPNGPTTIVSHFVRSSKQIAELLAELRKDTRVSALNGTMVSSGNHGHLFQISDLEKWYIWCANEFGVAAAKGYLGEWLDSDEVDVVAALWVDGLDVENEIQLAGGYCITPAKQMPDSTDKERALKFDMSMHPTPVSFPKTAISRVCRVKKTRPASAILNLESDSEFWATQKRFADLAMVLNTLPGVSCLPKWMTTYSKPIYPFGPFGGSGGGFYVHDTIGIRQTKITQKQRDDIEEALGDFHRLTDSEKDRFRTILSRLSQAKRRLKPEDRILDLGIAAEMMLLKDNTNRDQLSLSFRLRGSWLISEAAEQRKENYQLLKELYTYRSHVAHCGLLEDGNPQKIAKAQSRLPEYEALVEKICRRLLKNTKVAWDDLVLGDFTDAHECH